MILDGAVLLNNRLNNKNTIIPVEIIFETLYSYKKPVSKNKKEVICAKINKANMNFMENL